MPKYLKKTINFASLSFIIDVMLRTRKTWAFNLLY